MLTPPRASRPTSVRFSKKTLVRKLVFLRRFYTATMHDNIKAFLISAPVRQLGASLSTMSVSVADSKVAKALQRKPSFPVRLSYI